MSYRLPHSLEYTDWKEGLKKSILQQPHVKSYKILISLGTLKLLLSGTPCRQQGQEKKLTKSDKKFIFSVNFPVFLCSCIWTLWLTKSEKHFPSCSSNSSHLISVEKQFFQNPISELVESGILTGNPMIFKILWYFNKYLVENNFNSPLLIFLCYHNYSSSLYNIQYCMCCCQWEIACTFPVRLHQAQKT